MNVYQKSRWAYAKVDDVVLGVVTSPRRRQAFVPTLGVRCGALVLEASVIGFEVADRGDDDVTLDEAKDVARDQRRAHGG